MVTHETSTEPGFGQERGKERSQKLGVRSQESGVRSQGLKKARERGEVETCNKCLNSKLKTQNSKLITA
jgi:hypothetical protein